METDSGTLEDIEYTLPGQHGRGSAGRIQLYDRQHQLRIESVMWRQPAYPLIDLLA